MSKEEAKEKLAQILQEHGEQLKTESTQSLVDLIANLESEDVNKDVKFSTDIVEVLKSSNFKHGYNPASDEFEFKRDIGCFPVNDDVRKANSLPSNLPGIQRKDFRPTKAELNKINSQFALRELKTDEVKVFPVVLWGSDYDSHNEKFSFKATKEGRKLAPGAPGIEDHNTFNSDGVHAKLFDAEAVMDNGKYYLVGKAYVPDTAEHKSYIDGIEFAINSNVSVGVTSKRDDYMCDVCQRPMYKWSDDPKQIWCGHYTGQTIAKGQIVTATIDGISRFKEFSRVVVGAQRPAQFTKSDSNSNSDFQKSESELDKSGSGTTLPAVSRNEELEVDEIKKMLAMLEEQKAEFAKMDVLTESVKELKAEVEALKQQDPPQVPAVKTEGAAKPEVDSAKTEVPATSPAPVVQPKSEQEIDSTKALEVEKQLFSDRVKLLEDMQAANVESQKAAKDQLEANTQMIKGMADAYTALVKTCNQLVGQSQEDVLLGLQSSRAMSKTASAAEAELVKKDGGLNFGSVVGELTKMGDAAK